ncbi:hypothetical protein [Sphingomonas parapaucimobilis]|uniref:Uncharacterized protein n=1 Tax=Sphingomonas parapaucimobilis NBRC 15100 TaxID=1219049 RepID=A0A0A1W5N2_9SPHN|nr:hypothetical protein [Sphingomonas parapaucimobilis]GAM00725.1 hypothetical protein SP5_035_01260 [Sphingomonas parapaucimobilis NBRC 15100]
MSAALPFDPAKVGIERKRFSTTQGEVLLTYAGQPMLQYGDTIRLVGRDYVGIPDEEWMPIARREAIVRGLAADLVNYDAHVVAVERAMLTALGHHRSAAEVAAMYRYAGITRHNRRVRGIDRLRTGDMITSRTHGEGRITRVGEDGCYVSVDDERAPVFVYFEEITSNAPYGERR